ncbi:MAG: hypothetical protein GVY24_02025, partial [Planctomycetes bacterium]|jgi:hypothetical protein|nr:hypothetical protein [Planctomycetota bacterium]
VLVAASSGAAAGGLDGALSLAPVDAAGRAIGPAETIPLDWRGPAVAQLALDLPAIARPGLYAVTLHAAGAADTTTIVAVQATGGAAEED